MTPPRREAVKDIAPDLLTNEPEMIGVCSLCVGGAVGAVAECGGRDA
jgi:hypothetical protein